MFVKEFFTSDENSRNNTSFNMYSPRNNGSQNYNSPRTNASSRIDFNSPPDFNTSRNNTSRGMYSPNNTFQGMYSPQSSSYEKYSPHSSPQGMYSPWNTSQNVFSPRNAPQVMYSHRSSLPNREKLYRRPFNKSRNSSGFNSSNQSFCSNESFGSRGKSYDRWNKKVGHFERPHNIQDYINSSMVEDPWANLKSVNEAKKCVGSAP